jgi:DNA-binding transcriptional MerR regulator
MTISALGKTCGVSTPTIRYYEQINLLPKAERSQSGQRRYVTSDIERLTFIRRCRDFGFPIEEVRKLLSISTSSENGCKVSHDIAINHLDEIDMKIRELIELQASLRNLVTQCEVTCLDGAGKDCVAFSEMKSAVP